MIYHEKDYKNFFNNLRTIVLDQWKNENKIETNKINRINCNIKFFNLNELKEIKNLLTELSIVEDYKLKQISYGLNNYDLYFYGNKKILYNFFMRNKLNINLENDICRIYL